MAQSASKSCDICMSGPGHNYCEQCNQWLCENCKTLHLRSKISRNHTFLCGQNINPEEKLLCTEHDENFIFYCIDCDIPICKMCIVNKHKKHDTSEINESTQGLQAEVEQVIESKIKSVRTNLDKIEQGTKRYQSDVKEAIRTITEEGNQLKQLIDKKVQTMIASLEEKEATSLQALQSISAGFQNDLEKLKKCQNTFTNSQTITDVAKLLKQLKHIMSDLDDTEEKNPPLMPTVKYIMKKDITESEILKYFGDISVQEINYSNTVQESQKEKNQVMKTSSEVAIVSAGAKVMLYDNPSKKWVPAGSAQKISLSKVQIYRHTENNKFRIVGRKMANFEVSYFS
ncbi:unnamed protein product [Mytilus coruscus]|uniref:B box-type domain-containing protein n=1 Tax=Mytilus coruscus TaxID=42192 RepID=A0A6J8BJA1_MYTCO|nr:unnamed protein product [Mytilus coruscus]